MFMNLTDAPSLERFENQLIDRYMHEVKEISMISSINLNDFSVALVLGIFKKHFTSSDSSRAIHFYTEIRSISEAKVSAETKDLARLAKKAEFLAKAYFELKIFNEIAWTRCDTKPFEPTELAFLLRGSENLENAGKEFLDCCNIINIYKSYHKNNIQEDQLLSCTAQMCKEWRTSFNEVTTRIPILPVKYRLKFYSIKDLLLSNLAYLHQQKSKPVKARITYRRPFGQLALQGKSDLTKMAEAAQSQSPFITKPEPELFQPKAWPSTLEIPFSPAPVINAFDSDNCFQKIQAPVNEHRPVESIPQQDEQKLSLQLQKLVIVPTLAPQIENEKKYSISEAQYVSTLLSIDLDEEFVDESELLNFGNA